MIKQGIILMNLGSPDSTSVKDVRKYLNEFLMDERVIDIPLIWRTLLVKGIIVPFRAPKSAEAYKTIWTESGSPLVVNTKELQSAVQSNFEEPIEIAMRYGSLTPKRAYDNLMQKHPHLEEVILVPLYPHYAMSSYETAVIHMKAVHQQEKYSFKLSTIKPYYNEPHYIAAMSENIKPYLDQDYDHILFSYHGIPARHLTKTDPTATHCFQVNDCCNVDSTAHSTCYRHQCFSTTQLITQKLGIDASKFSISFQSRLGKGWLEPFTDIQLTEFPKKGIKKLLIICPAFVSDCLETLEEIEERGRESFMEAGGESYQMIPCLNTHPLWVKALTTYIKDYQSGNESMILQD